MHNDDDNNDNANDDDNNATPHNINAIRVICMDTTYHTRIVHHGYTALANKTSVLREAMLLFEPA